MSTDEENSTEGVFEVEQIVGIRNDSENPSRRLYRVRWKGCLPEDDTWEPKENLYSCDDLLKAFKKEYKEKKLRKKLNKEAVKAPLTLSENLLTSSNKKTASNTQHSNMNLEKENSAIRKEKPTNTKMTAVRNPKSESLEKKTKSNLVTDCTEKIDEYCQTRRQKLELAKIIEISRKEAESNNKPYKEKIKLAKNLELSAKETIAVKKPNNEIFELVKNISSEETETNNKNLLNKPAVSDVTIEPNLNKRKIIDISTSLGTPPNKKQITDVVKSSGVANTIVEQPSDIIENISNNSTLELENTPIKTGFTLDKNVLLSPLTSKIDSEYVPLLDQLQKVEVTPGTPEQSIETSEMSTAVTNQQTVLTDKKSVLATKNSTLPKSIIGFDGSKAAKAVQNLQELFNQKRKNSFSCISTNHSVTTTFTNSVVGDKLIAPTVSSQLNNTVTPTVRTPVTSTPVTNTPSLTSDDLTTMSAETSQSRKNILYNNEALNNVLSGIQIFSKLKKCSDVSLPKLKIGLNVTKSCSGDIENQNIKVSYSSSSNKNIESSETFSEESIPENEANDIGKMQKTQGLHKNEFNNLTLHNNDPVSKSSLDLLEKDNNNLSENNLDLHEFRKKPLAKSASLNTLKPSRSLKLLHSLQQPLAKPSKGAGNEKSKKLTYQEYKSKKNKKSSADPETQSLFLGFTKITKGCSGNALVSASSEDNLTVIQPKHNSEKPKMKKNKEKLRISTVNQMSTETDVLGNILQLCQSPTDKIVSVQKNGTSSTNTKAKAATDFEIASGEHSEEDILLEESLDEDDVEEEEEDDDTDLDEYSGDEQEFSMENGINNKEIPHTAMPGANMKKVQNFIVHQAILRGDKQMLIECCIDRQHINNYVDDDDKHTLLMKAVMECAADLVKILIEKGADPNIVSKTGKTPLMVAVENGQRKLVVLLIKNGAHLNIQTREGETALILACKSGYMEIIHVLLNSGADVKPALKYLYKVLPNLPIHLQTILPNSLHMHAEKLKCLTETVLKDLMVTSLHMELGEALMPCRCISPNESMEHDFFFPCSINASAYNCNVFLLALPVVFERNGHLNVQLESESKCLRQVLLNEQPVLSIIPAGRILYLLSPLINEINNVKILTGETNEQSRILICVYNTVIHNIPHITQTPVVLDKSIGLLRTSV